MVEVRKLRRGAIFERSECPSSEVETAKEHRLVAGASFWEEISVAGTSEYCYTVVTVELSRCVEAARAAWPRSAI